MEAPVKLAASVVAQLKKGVSSILEACNGVADAFSALEEAAWSQAEFLVFFDQLGAESIGPGSGDFLKTDSKGITTFDPKLKAGVYFRMRAVGRCEGFRSPEFVAANRTSSYSTLYRLSVLYNVISEKSSGSAQKKRDLAQKAILELVNQHGIGLTRKEVDEAVAKAQMERRSRAPVETLPLAPAQAVNGSKRVKLSELLAKEERYDLLLLTPSEEFLLDAENSSLGTLMDSAPYQDLRKSESNAYLIGPGNRLAGLQKLAQVTGDLSYCYCVREKPDDRVVIDLTKELVVFGSAPWSGKLAPEKNETPEAFICRALSESVSIGSKKLHLFAGEEKEGWDCCSPESSSNV